VAEQLMSNDALAAHVRDELGITESLRARPLQAALASAAAFAFGSLVPVAAAVAAPGRALLSGIATVGCLVLLGALAARVGGASVMRGAMRVAFWGVLAMAMTALAGRGLEALS
jgi:VIT1/CCC1 family predicted Fe2+/Mn2+ transporter